MTSRPRIGIILSSTRPGRNGEAVAAWVLDLAQQRDDADYELIDLAKVDLPLLDEPVPASMGQYQHEHTKRWAATIDSFDGFVIVTPEYNHAPPASLTNALSYLFAEWNNKAVGFVSYGSVGGARAVEQLRCIVGELMMADVRAAVTLGLATDFQNYSTFTPQEHSVAAVTPMLDQLLAWTGALAPLRKSAQA